MFTRLFIKWFANKSNLPIAFHFTSNWNTDVLAIIHLSFLNYVYTHTCKINFSIPVNLVSEELKMKSGF